MKNRTLYISDLDGTLLNSNSVISENSVEIINRIIDRGALFSIATARTPATVDGLMSRINGNLPYIVMTGASMWNGKMINRHYMKVERMRLLRQICHEYGIDPFFYTYNDSENVIEAFHSPNFTDYDRNFYEQRVNAPHKKFSLTEDIPEEAQHKTMLMFATADYEKVEKAYIKAKSLLSCSMTCYRDIFDPSVGFLEVMAAGVSKAAAVKELAESVNAEEIIVFGDSPNDLSMRDVATKFIAPENASPEVLAVADAVIGNNNDDSVAKYILSEVSR